MKQKNDQAIITILSLYWKAKLENSQSTLLCPELSSKTPTCLKAKQTGVYGHYRTQKLNSNLLQLISPYPLLTRGNSFPDESYKSERNHGCFKELEKALISQQCVQLTFLTKAMQNIPAATCSVLCYMAFPYIYPFF